MDVFISPRVATSSVLLLVMGFKAWIAHHTQSIGLSLAAISQRLTKSSLCVCECVSVLAPH